MSDPAPVRLWPGVVIVTIQWALRLFASAAVGLMGGTAGAILVLIWFAFFSRLPRSERWAGIGLVVAGLALTRLILHKSIAGGMMGMMFFFMAAPLISLALVGWAVWAQRLAGPRRLAALAAAVFAACGVWALVRTDGITGEASSQLAWRWTPDHEQRLLASIGPAPTAKPAEAVSVPAAADWPGFRGPQRDSVVPGTRIATDWAITPPKQMWRRPAGPGWSSFAVSGGLIYTQEQLGEHEIVSCYRLATGEPVWSHRDAARFWESNGGAGPRATPSLSEGRVYALGATGILNALDAATGAVIWSRNAGSDTGAKTPEWGFSGSPLVSGGAVIVALSGRLAAYDTSTGERRWTVPTGGGSYGSPQWVSIKGVPQIVLLNGAGAASVAPADGKLLWKHAWEGATILQPAMTADGGLLITTGDASGGAGTRRLEAAPGPDGWKVEERWTSRGLKPYFNDLVVHRDHAFGFDGSILSCIALKDGERKWKGGRFGHGQMLLLPDQDLLLVLSEEGEVALVRAAPDQFTEVARFRAMNNKTWNHPVMVGGVLLVRNGEEMVAYRM